MSTSTSETVWGSVSCLGTPRHADQGYQTSNLPITRCWLYPWATADSVQRDGQIDRQLVSHWHLSSCPIPSLCTLTDLASLDRLNLSYLTSLGRLNLTCSGLSDIRNSKVVSATGTSLVFSGLCWIFRMVRRTELLEGHNVMFQTIYIMKNNIQ